MPNKPIWEDLYLLARDLYVYGNVSTPDQAFLKATHFLRFVEQYHHDYPTVNLPPESTQTDDSTVT